MDRLAAAKARNAELKRLLAEKQASEKTTMGQSLARGAKNVVSGALDVGDFIATPIREGINLGSKAIGSNYRMRPMAEEFSEGIDRATSGYTAPKTKQHKVEEAITRGLTSLPAGGAIGKAIPAGVRSVKGIKDFLTGSSELSPVNAVSTAGAAGLAQNALNENPDNIVGALGAGLVGGLAPQGARLATNAGRTLAKERIGKGLASKVNFDPSAMEGFEQAGITPQLADVAKSKITKMLSNMGEHIPFVGKPLTERKENQYDTALRLLRQGQYKEAPLSRTEAAALTTKGARIHHQKQKDIHQSMFGQVERDIDSMGDIEIAPHNISSAIEGLTRNLKTATMKNKFFKTPAGAKVKELEKLLLKEGGLDYHEAKQILDEINDQVTTHGTIGKHSQGKLKHLGEALNQDIVHSLDPHFERLGKEAKSNWKESKALYSEFANNEIPHLNKIFKGDKAGATDAFLNLAANTKKGAEQAKLALQGLTPQERVRLMDAVNERLGQSQQGQPFSVNAWAKNFNGLDDAAKDLVTQHLGKDNQKKAYALVDAVNSIKGTFAEANTSKSGYTGALYMMADKALGSAGHLMYGNPLPAIKNMAALTFGRAGAHALTNKKFVNLMYNSMRAKDLPTFVKRLENGSKMSGLEQANRHAIQSTLAALKNPRPAAQEGSQLDAAKKRNLELKAQLQAKLAEQQSKSKWPKVEITEGTLVG